MLGLGNHNITFVEYNYKDDILDHHLTLHMKMMDKDFKV